MYVPAVSMPPNAMYSNVPLHNKNSMSGNYKKWTVNLPFIMWSLSVSLAVVCTNFSPGSTTTTSGMTSQGSNTLPRAAPPMSPRNSMLKRRQRKKEHKSSCRWLFYCMTSSGDVHPSVIINSLEGHEYQHRFNVSVSLWYHKRVAQYVLKSWWPHTLHHHFVLNGTFGYNGYTRGHGLKKHIKIHKKVYRIYCYVCVQLCL